MNKPTDLGCIVSGFTPDHLTINSHKAEKLKQGPPDTLGWFYSHSFTGKIIYSDNHFHIKILKTVLDITKPLMCTQECIALYKSKYLITLYIIIMNNHEGKQYLSRYDNKIKKRRAKNKKKSVTQISLNFLIGLKNH